MGRARHSVRAAIGIQPPELSAAVAIQTLAAHLKLETLKKPIMQVTVRKSVTFAAKTSMWKRGHQLRRWSTRKKLSTPGFFLRVCLARWSVRSQSQFVPEISLSDSGPPLRMILKREGMVAGGPGRPTISSIVSWGEGLVIFHCRLPVERMAAPPNGGQAPARGQTNMASGRRRGNHARSLA